jgi:MFS family permease
MDTNITIEEEPRGTFQEPKRKLSRFKDFLKAQSRNFHVLTVRGLFANFAGGLTQNYTSVYAVELGADPVELGSLRSIGDLVNAFLSAPTGWLADRYGLKKLYLIGLILEALVPLGYALSWNWQMLVVPIIFFSMTWVITYPIERILLANALRGEDRATGFGIFSSISQLPLIFAPIIAGVIVTWLGGISASAIQPLYYISFIIILFTLLWIHLRLKEPSTKLAKYEEGFLKGFLELASRKEVRKWLLIEILGSFTFGATMPFIMVYAVQVKHADALTLGFMGSALNIVSILTSIPIGRMGDRLGRKKTILLLRPALYASYLLLVAAPGPEILIIAFAFRGILWSGFNVWVSMQLEIVPPEQRGRWMGTINTLRSIARIPAPIFGGLLWTYVDPSIPFILLVLVDLLIRMPILITIPETLKRPSG